MIGFIAFIYVPGAVALLSFWRWAILRGGARWWVILLLLFTLPTTYLIGTVVGLFCCSGLEGDYFIFYRGPMVMLLWLYEAILIAVTVWAFRAAKTLGEARRVAQQADPGEVPASRGPT
jgi:hypothetical protein